MSMRTPLGRVRGLGSAKSGTEHFWRQRVTAVANVPLTIAGIIIVVSLLGRNHAAVVQVLGSPLIAILLLLFVISVTYHMRLGLQVVIEYVRRRVGYGAPYENAPTRFQLIPRRPDGCLGRPIHIPKALCPGDQLFGQHLGHCFSRANRPHILATLPTCL